jgi:membrane protein
MLDVAVSFLVITLLFALIFKLLPDVTVHWKDVWIGALSTSALFMIGKSLIGMYIGSASIGSVYGAAGSVVVILIWTYYSSLILFFGAELTKAYARRYDREEVVPTDQAVSVTRQELAKQGITKEADLQRAVARSKH